jgi:RNA polymerase sigma-70 factor, ECF subfamily
MSLFAGDSVDDAHLRTLLAAGQAREAATAALRSLGPQVLGYLRVMLRDEDEARDAFSAFAETLWKALPSFRFESSLRTWAYRLAWSTVKSARGAAWRRKVRRFESGEASILAEEMRTATAVRVDKQRRVLEELRGELTPEEASLLVLRIDQGLSWQEVAEVMSAQGSPVDWTTVAKRFERLKKRLATRLRELGLVE